MKIDTKTIVIAAITLALTVALAPLPFVFMLPLLFTCTTRGMKMSLFMGLAFGVTSFLYSLSGGSVLAVAFVKAPWIAILPRIFVGFCAHGAFVLSKRFIKGGSKPALAAPYIIAAAVGSLTNTVTVVGLLAIFMRGTAYEAVTILMFIPTMLTFGAIEIVVYSLTVPAVSISVDKAMSRFGRTRGARVSDVKSLPQDSVTNTDKTDAGNAGGEKNIYLTE